VGKTSCDLEHDIIVVSQFVQVEYSLEETPLEEPCDDEVVEVKPYDLELIDLISIRCPPKLIPTSVVLPPSSLLHPSMDPSMYSSLESETRTMYALNLD